MVAFVLDCSVVMTWCFEDEAAPYTSSVLKSLHRSQASVYDLARYYTLSPYDTAYLHLAVRHAIPLATQDKAIETAAKAIGVTLYQPDVPGVT